MFAVWLSNVFLSFIGFSTRSWSSVASGFLPILARTSPRIMKLECE